MFLPVSRVPRWLPPALLTLAAPAADRGAALGVFATSQFLGAFFGGVGAPAEAGGLQGLVASVMMPPGRPKAAWAPSGGSEAAKRQTWGCSSAHAL